MNNLKTKAPRSSSIELLRIIGMVMIIFHHFSIHGTFAFNSNTNLCLNGIFSLFGKVGVNLFILISGYFTVNSGFRVKKFIRLICQVTFYSLLMFAAALILGAVKFNKGSILQSVLPLIFGKGYWFIVIYLELYMLMPLISKGMDGISKRYSAFIISAFFLLWSVIGYAAETVSTAQEYSFSNLGWFVIIYMSGGYLRRYPEVIPGKKICAVVFAALGIAIIAMRAVYVLYFAESEAVFAKILYKISGYQINNPLSLMFAVFLFMFFIQWDMKYSRLINLAATGTFGVYLMHDNRLFSKYMWKTIFRTKEMSDSAYFVLYAAGVTALIFIAGTVVDIFRRKLLEEPVFSSKKLNSRFEKLQNFLDK